MRRGGVSTLGGERRAARWVARAVGPPRAPPSALLPPRGHPNPTLPSASSAPNASKVPAELAEPASGPATPRQCAIGFGLSLSASTGVGCVLFGAGCSSDDETEPCAGRAGGLKSARGPRTRCALRPRSSGGKAWCAAHIPLIGRRGASMWRLTTRIHPIVVRLGAGVWRAAGAAWGRSRVASRA